MADTKATGSQPTSTHPAGTDEAEANGAEPAGVPFTLNGSEVLGRPGELVIAAAERSGVYIPRFCYHERMRPVGMCRMCIVEIDTGRGPSLQPACMLECAEGMKVDTTSPVTKKAQDGVLEFLLINHPLDCPVCDKGGECPLQDQTMAYGPGESRFVEQKRHHEKPIAVSDLVLLDRERCVLCDRCTRFADEVAGDPLIHFLDRGVETQVNTFPDDPFSSYFSGNTIQICPVGALTGTDYRFRARPWDLEEVESTCTQCSMGCRMAIQSSRNEVLRFVGVDIEAVNWGWMCDKGRFSHQAVSSPDRLEGPLVRSGGLPARSSGSDASDGAGLVAASWSSAISAAAAALREGLDRSGPAGIGVIGGARLTNEAAYAWAKLAKGVIGTDNVDAQMGDGLPAQAVVGVPRATIAEVCKPGSTVVLLGPDPKEELGVLFLRLRHAVINDGVKLVEISPQATGITSLAAVSLHPLPAEQGAVVRALSADVPRDTAGVAAAELARAKALIDAAGQGELSIVLGRPSVAEGPEGVLDAAGALLAARPDAKVLSGLRRGNVHGAIDAGLAPGLLPGRVSLDEGRDWFADLWPAVPASVGLDTAGILHAAAEGRIDTLVLLGADPLSDFPDADLAARALAGARRVIAIDRFLTSSSRRADVVLAAAGFAEVEGTTTNVEGRISAVHQRVTPPGTAQADWILAAELAFQLGADLGLESVADIQAELERVSGVHAGLVAALADGRLDAEGVVFPDAGVAADLTEAEPEAEGFPLSEEGSTGGTEDEAVESDEQDGPGEQAGPPGAGGPPPTVAFVPGPAVEPPAHDAYSLRLVSTRKLYDEGTTVQRSPLLAGQAPGTALRVNPYDFERVGVEAGGRVRVVSSRGSVTAQLVADAGVPRGVASITFNQPGVRAADLVDSAQLVTDVRVEPEVRS